MNFGLLVTCTFILLGLSETQAHQIRTCQDIERDILSRELKIQRLERQLEEYKLADPNKIKDIEDECTRYETCSSCLRAENGVNCGWCFLHGMCTLQKNCPESELDSASWIIHGLQGCPRIRKINPQQIALVTPQMLQIDIPHIPTYDGIFICEFEISDTIIISEANRTDNGITCLSPPVDALPKIPNQNKYLEARVSSRIANGRNFASPTNITIYDCSRYESCSECASSPFPCSWCTSGNRCTHDVEEHCRNDIIVDSSAISRPRIRKGGDFCPKIIPPDSKADSSNLEEIVIPSGLKKRITVKTENIANFIVMSRFSCAVSGHERVSAQILGDIIYCDVIQFNGIGRNPFSNLSFNVLWDGGDKRLDNPLNIHVLVYDCSLMASSCGACLELPEQYNCGWCEETDSCLIRDKCESSEWLDRKQRCIKPKVTAFYPKSGLVEKDINVTIEGENFGKQPNDVAVRLITEENEIIAECEPYEDLYVPSSKIVCKLTSLASLLETNATLRGFFEVLLWNQYIAVSNQDFAFVDPVVTELTPVKGGKSGGTVVEIRGRHLDAGNNVEVTILDNVCKIISREYSLIRCITSPSRRTFSSAVQVTFDGELRTTPSYFFYVEDPWIKTVGMKYYRDGPRGTTSGGNEIFVEGLHLDHIMNPPYIYVTVEDEEYVGFCHVISPTSMKCSSPRIPSERLHFCGSESFIPLDYGFKIDDVEDVQNISSHRGFKKFNLFPDPVFYPFHEKGKIKVYKTDYLIIQGRHIDRVYNEEDITVEIGGAGKCILMSMSSSQLTCRPPDTQPLSIDGDSKKLPEVVVKVSDVLEYFIGFLRYGA